MDFDKIKQNILNSSETSTSESENIAGSELHEEFEINNFLPEFEPLKLSGKNLAQQYVSAFNTGMNVYQCLNYLQGYVYTLVTAMNETIEAWNTVVPLLEQATKEWTDEEFDYKWSILKPQVIELVTNLTIETFNKSWEELKPVVIKLAQDTTDAEFKKQWDILRPQVITLVEETTTTKFNEEWEKLRPTIIQLTKDTTIEQFNKSWTELKPTVIELAQTTASTKFDEKWTELRPQIIELAQTTTNTKFDEKWEALQPTLTETVNNLAKTQTTTTFNEEWTKLKPQVIDLSQTTTNTKFDEKWTELQPTLNTTVENLVNTNLETFKSTLWQEVTKNESFPFLLPENFGAVGDGTTDDSAAFNACIAKASEKYKYILLQTKGYSIQNTLSNITSITFIGIGSSIIVNNNLLFNNINRCEFNDITFVQLSKNQTTALINNCNDSNFKGCHFNDFAFLFNRIQKSSSNKMTLLDGCYLKDSSLSNQYINRYEDIFVVNNTNFYYDTRFNGNFLIGLLNGTIIFNDCIFSNLQNEIVLIKLNGNIIFNNCAIESYRSSMIMIPNDINVDNISIEFNNCNIRDSSTEKTNMLLDVQATNSIIPTLKIINTNISIGTIYNSNVECSLWLENNIMDVKPIINSGTGKVNLVEIQQKYSTASENIFPWPTETPTFESNVALNKYQVDGYYVLTENKDKTIKKLDCYFKVNQYHIKGTSQYDIPLSIGDLDLTGYTLKSHLLKNDVFKLEDSDNNLIDYVYLNLNSANISSTDPQFTTIQMHFTPAITKFTGKEEADGIIRINTCITLILEKN